MSITSMPPLTNSAAEQPYSFRRESDPETAEYVYKMTSVLEAPAPLRLMLGDALHNLRSTLDHAAYAVVEAGSVKPNKHTYFPVFDNAKDYSALVESRIPGLRQPCYDVFNRIQPYQGGCDWVWKLHKLDIINKHRLLLALSNVPVIRTATPSEARSIGDSKTVVTRKQSMINEMVFGHAPGTEVFKTVQAGDEIGRFPGTKEYEHMGFAFDVAIHEPEVIRGMPTYLILRMFCSRVLEVINNLTAFM